uniref:Uncharacterized protein n=1 Tax=Anguilla anguilla TaxID=7936 RepID=A0A0E9VQR1_ANGAN
MCVDEMNDLSKSKLDSCSVFFSYLRELLIYISFEARP